jgi:hypothetical protein
VVKYRKGKRETILCPLRDLERERERERLNTVENTKPQNHLENKTIWKTKPFGKQLGKVRILIYKILVNNL